MHCIELSAATLLTHRIKQSLICALLAFSPCVASLVQPCKLHRLLPVKAGLATFLRSEHETKTNQHDTDLRNASASPGRVGAIAAESISCGGGGDSVLFGQREAKASRESEGEKDMMTAVQFIDQYTTILEEFDQIAHPDTYSAIRRLCCIDPHDLILPHACFVSLEHARGFVATLLMKTVAEMKTAAEATP